MLNASAAASSFVLPSRMSLEIVSDIAWSISSWLLLGFRLFTGSGISDSLEKGESGWLPPLCYFNGVALPASCFAPHVVHFTPLPESGALHLIHFSMSLLSLLHCQEDKRSCLSIGAGLCHDITGNHVRDICANVSSDIQRAIMPPVDCLSTSNADS